MLLDHFAELQPPEQTTSLVWPVLVHKASRAATAPTSTRH
jgi:hypothetical protein